MVLLPGLDFAEQVFQFYVLNNKGRPLKATELRRIVSTLLTSAPWTVVRSEISGRGRSAPDASATPHDASLTSVGSLWRARH